MDGYRQASSDPNPAPANWKIVLWSIGYMIPLFWMWSVTDFPDSFGVQVDRGRAGVVEDWYYSYLLLQRHHVLDVVTFIYMWSVVAGFVAFVGLRLARKSNFSLYSKAEPASALGVGTVDALATRATLPKFTLSEWVLISGLLVVVIIGLAWAFDFHPQQFSGTLASEGSVRRRCFNEEGSYQQSDVTTACRQLLEDSTVAIRAEPNNADAYFNRGFAFEHAGELNRAIADFSAVIRLAPDRSQAYYYRWAAYKDSGNEQRADADLEKLDQLVPTFAAQLRRNR